MSRYGLKEADLDREFNQDFKCDIAVEFGADWEIIGCYLGFSLDEVRDISRENCNQKMCRVALLDNWSKREGKGATFLKLARALHRGKRRDLVELLCTRLKSTLSLVPVSRSVTSWDMPSGNDQQVQQQQLGSNPKGILAELCAWFITIHQSNDMNSMHALSYKVFYKLGHIELVFGTLGYHYTPLDHYTVNAG